MSIFIIKISIMGVIMAITNKIIIIIHMLRLKYAWSVDLSGAFIRHFLRKCAFETFYAEVLYLTESLQTCEVTPSGLRLRKLGFALL